MNSCLVWTQTNLFTLGQPDASFSGAIQDPQGDLEKKTNFQACFQGDRSHKKHLQGFHKTLKNERQKSMQKVSWTKAPKTNRF